MINKIVIVGVGETAELALDYFTKDSVYEVVAFSAEAVYLQEHSKLRLVGGLPVVSFEEMVNLYPPNEYLAFVAMSFVHLNRDRAKFYKKIKNLGYEFASYVSSRAYIGSNVTIGENCFIMEDNVLQRNVKIGNDVILWSGNHIGHQTCIKDHVFLSSHVAVSGFCSIGEHCFLGINSCIGDYITIAPDCWISGGVTIMNDTKQGEIYRLKKIKPERLSTKIVFGL